MNDDEPNEVSVDLSADDADATLDELPAEGDEPDEPTPEVTEDELLERAQEEAARLRDAADGNSQREKVANAIEGAQQSYQQNAQVLQKLRGNENDIDQRIDRLELTKERVEDQPDDADVVQTLAGGISMEVKPDDAYEDDEIYTRSDLLDEIDETVDALEDQLERTRERADNLQLDLEKLQKAIELLQQLGDRLEERPPDPDEWIEEQVNGNGNGEQLPSGRPANGPR